MVPVTNLDTGRFQKGEYMPRRGHSSEQIFNKLRQVEVSVVNGKTVALSVREIGVTEQIFYRWRSEYRGLSLDQAKKLKRFCQNSVLQSKTDRPKYMLYPCI
jgi:transposase-like protein